MITKGNIYNTKHKTLEDNIDTTEYTESILVTAQNGHSIKIFNKLII